MINESASKISENCKIYETILSTKHVVCNNSECNVLRVSVWSKVWICGLMLAGFVGYNLARSMEVLSLLNAVCCLVEVSEMGQSLVHRSQVQLSVFVSECDHESLTRRESRPARAIKPQGEKSFDKSQSHILLNKHLCKICFIYIFKTI
jgi:hypothetical protein